MAQGLEVNTIIDGYIVYHTERERVHFLNPTATLILELCNGRHAEGDLPRLLQSAFDLPTPPVEEVAICLQTLRAEGLII
jgi:hypothetical protein